MPVHGPSVPDVTTHCDTCGCLEEESWPFLRDTRPIPLLHQTQEHFSSSHFLLWYLFSPFSFYQSQMLKKCLRPAVWRVTAGGTEKTYPCGPSSFQTDTLGGKQCILTKSHCNKKKGKTHSFLTRSLKR